jgi:hypothetical protein
MWERYERNANNILFRKPEVKEPFERQAYLGG